MGALQLTYEPKFKIVHRSRELMRSHEAKSVQLWLSTDPLAEKFPSHSPYCYVMNNPLNLIDPDGRAPEPPSWLKAAYNRLKSDCTPTSYEKNKFDKDVVQPLKRALDKVEDFATNGVMFWVGKNDQKKDGLVKPRKPKDRSKVATADASATNTLITLTGTNSEPRGKTLKERTDGVANVEEKADEASKKVNNSANEKETKPNQSDNGMKLKNYEAKSGNYHWVRKESNIKEEKK